MIESLLIRDVELVCPEGILQGDLLVRDGKIVRIADKINASAELEIRETGLTLLPGVIDPHVHFRDPGAEHKEDLISGPRAAASGGVTSFFDMPNTKPAATTAELIAQKKQLASEKSIINYNFFIGATNDNLDECLAVENVPGIKIFVGSSTGNMLVNDSAILDQFFRSGNRLIAVHSEDEATIRANQKRFAASRDVSDHMRIRSDEAAIKCTKMLVELAAKYNRRLHICHLTTKQEAEFLAKKKPACVTTEVTPQHLLLAAPEVYEQFGTFAQINPPIRTADHRDALFKALKNGVIDFVATDHAPHTIDEKAVPFGDAPSGMPGVEHSLALMLTLVAQGRCSLEDVVRWLSVRPAEAYRIGNKGQLKVGFDGDLVLVDRKKTWAISNDKVVSKAGWTCFDGYSVTGLPLATFVNGQMVFREGDFFTSVKGCEVQINNS